MADPIDLGIAGLSDAREIGAGGFGTVYVATDDDFGRSVAVKILERLNDAGRRRFDRERLSMGRLDRHPNVVTPYRSGYTAAGLPYLVMEYVEGGSLADLVDRDGPMDWDRAVALILPIAGVLGHAHSLGVLHRDVKPANILVTGDGVPKLTDFGIAAIQEQTATAAIVYTLAHAPPETFAGGDDRRDQRSDLYSLASTLYTLVAGSPPFHRQTDGDSTLAYITRIAEHAVPNLGGDPRHDRFLRAALAKDPDDRPADAARFAEQLLATRDEAGEAFDPPPVATASRPRQGAEPPGDPRSGEPTVPAAELPAVDRSDDDGGSSGPSDEGSPRRPAIVVGVGLVLALVVAGAIAIVIRGGAGTGGGDTEAADDVMSVEDGGDDAVAASGGDGVLTIGALVPDTGPSSVAILGPGQRAAIQRAVEDVNFAGGVLGRDVVVVVEDSGGSGSVAVEATDRLLDDGVDAIVGPASSSVSLEVIDRITGAGVVQISPANTSLDLGDVDDGGFYFRTAPSDQVQGAALAQLVADDGARTVAFLAREDGYGAAMLAAATDRYREIGPGEIVEELFYAPGADPPTEIDVIAEADPDAIVLIGFAETGPILQNLIDRGLGPQDRLVYGLDPFVFTGAVTGLEDPSDAAGLQVTRPGFDLEGLAPQVVDDFQAADPGVDIVDFSFAAEAYDAVTVLALAAVAAGTDDPAAVAEEISSVTRDGESCNSFRACAPLLADGVDIDYDGHSGRLELNEDGDPSEAAIRVAEFDGTDWVVTHSVVGVLV